MGASKLQAISGFGQFAKENAVLLSLIYVPFRGSLRVAGQVSVLTHYSLPKLANKVSHVVHVAQSRIAGKFGVAAV